MWWLWRCWDYKYGRWSIWRWIWWGLIRRMEKIVEPLNITWRGAGFARNWSLTSTWCFSLNFKCFTHILNYMLHTFHMHYVNHIWCLYREPEGLVCWNISLAKEPQNHIRHFCVIWGYHVQLSITQNVYKIETYRLQLT